MDANLNTKGSREELMELVMREDVIVTFRMTAVRSISGLSWTDFVCLPIRFHQ